MSSDADRPRLDRLPPGTTLEVRSELEEWLVREAYACTEPHPGAEAYHWTEYLLQERSSNARAWLSVEFDDGEWEVVLFERQVQLAEVGYQRGQEFPDEFRLDGQTFSLSESGALEATKVGTKSSYRGRYGDYVHRDGRVLSIEAYPDPTNTPRETDVEIWQGRLVEARALDVNVGDAGASPHLVPPPLPSAERERPEQQASSQAPAWVRQSLQPVTRQYNVMSDAAQRKARLTMIGAGVAVLLVIVLVIALL